MPFWKCPHLNKKKSVHWHYFLLVGVGILVVILISAFQRSPGYLDADYYFAGGKQLFLGKGFTEPYLWNYLDNPSSLPNPSHTYWMPMASILAAMGMRIFNQDSWQFGRLFFQGIAIAIPLMTYKLSYSFHQKRNLALVSGFLAAFCGYYLVYQTTSDTFGIYILTGGVFLSIACSKFKGRYFLLGMLAAVMYLTRSDGLLWLLGAFIWVFISAHQNGNNSKVGLVVISEFLFIATGFILVSGGWFWRNYHVFGSLFPPGNYHALWLTNYNQIFTIDPNRLTFSEWMKQGFSSAFQARVFATGVNLQNSIAAQGEIILTPFILIGAWKLRLENRIQLAAILWIFIFLAMSLVFPFAGSRGGFFHSSASLQSLNWSMAPIGLEASVSWIGRRRGWVVERATRVFLVSLIFFSVVFSFYVASSKLFSFDTGKAIWDLERERYNTIAAFIKTSDPRQKTVVIVANPPGFYLESGMPSVAVPDGDEKAILTVARRFSADYLVLESDSLPPGLIDLYKHPEGMTGFELLGKVENALIFKVGN